MHNATPDTLYGVFFRGCEDAVFFFGLGVGVCHIVCGARLFAEFVEWRTHRVIGGLVG